MNAENRPKIGVGVIVVRNGKVLLGLRRSEHGNGAWSFPGGHLEYRESPEECAMRELEEETGLQAFIEDVERGPFTNDIFEESRKHYVTLFMIVKNCTGEPEAREPEKCERWEWFEWEKLPEPLFLPIVNLRKLEYDFREG